MVTHTQKIKNRRYYNGKVTVHGLTALICKNPRRVGNHVKLHFPMLPYEQKESLSIILFVFLHNAALCFFALRMIVVYLHHPQATHLFADSADLHRAVTNTL